MLALAGAAVFASKNPMRLEIFPFRMSIRMVRGGQDANLAGARVRTGVFDRPVRDGAVDSVLSETAGADGRTQVCPMA
ncbi:hypothetical protein B2M20_06765 [Nitrobacter vulgaris]|uniref:Uncharacterized protein n=1 Tax=Nitrobacter vulgaris TaxID=29421 RepID=A0A1V4HZT2_NITVU|nr:hypothetical protein B2M20_06765 [Nitrobacter vulgaris]